MMKNLRNTILVVVLSMCSLASYASWYDRDEIIIPKSYINNTGQTFLLEKAAKIFGTKYELELTNIYLSQYWFCCDIVINEAEYVWVNLKLLRSAPMSTIKVKVVKVLHHQ